MTRYLLNMVILISSIGCSVTGKTNLETKAFQLKLWTDDFGILTSRDLVDESNGALEWQCFSIEKVKAKFSTWRDNDPMGPSNILVTMCELNITIANTNQNETYGSRRAKEATYCREFMKAWNKITKNEAHICLAGEQTTTSDSKNDATPKKKLRGWVWDKIKTHKGCYSYLSGDLCDNQN